MMTSRLRRRRVSIAFSLAVLLFLPLAGMAWADDSYPSQYHFTPRTYKGRTIAPAMSYLGADWLEREEREHLEQPEKVLDTLQIAAGSVVADIGAGTGYYSLRLARRVGERGRVLATDIQPEMLSRLRTNMKKTGVSNIEPILSTPNDARLPVSQLDLVLMVDVYHELAQPQETMAQVRHALKPNGRLVLIEYRGEDPTVPIKPDHKMTLIQVRAELEPLGFQLQQVFDFLPRQHLIIFIPTAAVSDK